MSKLDSFFTEQNRIYHHSLIKHLEDFQPDKVEVEVRRPKDVLGYKPAKLFVHLIQNGQKQLPKEFEWEDGLNQSLIDKGVKAVSEDNEKTRFGLALRDGFRPAEIRYGDGFFNAVLGEFLRQSEFAGFPEVSNVLNDVHTNEPYKGGRGYEDCLALIDHAIRDRARELMKELGYPQPEAARILAGAVANYLDERFTVSDRRRLGWT